MRQNVIHSTGIINQMPSEYKRHVVLNIIVVRFKFCVEKLVSLWLVNEPLRSTVSTVCIITYFNFIEEISTDLLKSDVTGND